MNGYQIIQSLKDRSGGRWKPSPGAVYPALSQLEDEGLIEPFDYEGRKAFRLTEQGRAEAEKLKDWSKPWEEEDQDRGASADGQTDMWLAMGQAGMAAHAVTQTGDPNLIRAATELLGETRRGLYRLLAEEQTESDVIEDQEIEGEEEVDPDGGEGV